MGTATAAQSNGRLLEILHRPVATLASLVEAAGHLRVAGVAHIDIVTVRGIRLAWPLGPHLCEAAIEQSLGRARPTGALVLRLFATLAERTVWDHGHGIALDHAVRTLFGVDPA